MLASCATTKMPAPEGPYAIGVAVKGFTDPSRPEIHAADTAARREILARIWYPAASVEGCRAMPYFSKPLIKALGKHMGFPEFLLSQAPSHSFIDAPIGSASTRWPVIVFAHGFGSYDRQNLSQMEELASLGFVVVSLSFPYESALCEFPDGRLVEEASGGDIQTVLGMARDQKALVARLVPLYKAVHDAPDAASRLAAMRKLQDDPYNRAMGPLLETRFADAVYVLEHLDELNALPTLNGRLDTQRVGFYGHSFGGALAMEIALRRPDLIKAVVDMDCFVYDSSRSGVTSLKVPTLFMYSTDQKFASVRIPSDGINDLYARDASAPVWSLSYIGSGHYNFSDSGYIGMLKGMGMNGPGDGYALGLVIRKQLSAFFDKYLMDSVGALDFGDPLVRVEGDGLDGK